MAITETIGGKLVALADMRREVDTMTLDECIYFLQDLKRTVSWGADQKDEEDFCYSVEDLLNELKDLRELKVIREHMLRDASALEQMGYDKALDDVTDIASWHEEGLGGYYTITSEELERLKGRWQE